MLIEKILNYLRNVISNRSGLSNRVKNSTIGLALNNYRLKLSYRSYTVKNLQQFDDFKKLLQDKVSIDTFEMIRSKRLNNVVSNMYIKHHQDQYFCFNELGIVYSNKEFFVDAGAFDGDTMESFIRNVGKNFKEIHSIEPDQTNYQKLTRKIQKLKIANIYAHNMGVWNHETELGFSDNASESSKLNTSNSGKIKVNSIDNLFSDKPVSFIKMDVEGAEYKALLGSEKTIKKNKPKLAICVYHKPEDIIEIPKLILEFNPTYKFFLRHHDNNFYETVLYAY